MHYLLLCNAYYSILTHNHNHSRFKKTSEN
nr:MAG TPA: hypothetical protein [Caudoviricetes sp.]